MLFKVIAYEKREIGDEYKVTNIGIFDRLEDAEKVAELTQKEISDVYGMSYTNVIDMNGEVVTMFDSYFA